MPRKPGKQKRDAKRKKKRDQRHKARFSADAKRKAASKAAEIIAASGVEDLRERCGYDASRDPVAGWLDIEEQERLDRVTRYHETALPKAKLPPSLARHAGLHVVVEDQLVSGEPPQARKALQQLMSDGMSRHDAIHAVGWVVTKHMRSAIEGRKAMDNDAYLKDLDSLTLESWLAMAGVG
jgi:uncharacterized protein YoaH (UPF0181 family)